MAKQLDVDKFKQISIVANIVNCRDADKAWRYTDAHTLRNKYAIVTMRNVRVCVLGMELLEIAFMDCLHFCVKPTNSYAHLCIIFIWRNSRCLCMIFPKNDWKREVLHMNSLFLLSYILKFALSHLGSYQFSSYPTRWFVLL